ncbi:DUF3368 domain-containing protein [Desulfococcaceae bacterium HSG8]|nr:DUF3368 domain-containing protein [Desulfococcaceae bacterium HSG8]
MIVSDTTPISNFLHLDRIEILEQMFPAIHIPEAVRQEIETAFSYNVRWQQRLKDGFLVIRKVKNPLLARQLLLKLHPGEAEALCICIENNAKLCLLDDKDARIAAALNHIPVIGTLGILIQAKKRGLIGSVKEMMDILKNQHHFWISKAMYEEVLRLSHEN